MLISYKKINILTLTLLSISINIYGQCKGKEKTNCWYLDGIEQFIGVDYHGVRNVIEKSKITPKENIIVATIDTGFDLNHPFLSNLAWLNLKEKPQNGIDDDGNGYIDDIHGWNFLGNSKDKTISKTGTEAFREYKRLRKIFGKTPSDFFSKNQETLHTYFKKMERKAGIDKYIVYEKHLAARAQMYKTCDSLMTQYYPNQATKVQDFYNIGVQDTTNIMTALNTVARLLAAYPKDKSWTDVVTENIDKYKLARKRIQSLDNFDDDPHIKLGNTPNSFSDLYYGNNKIDTTPDHGTMVAGLVALGATQANAKIQIMGVRAIPDGDEYDKDVVSAIKYAVDNGAKIINMSFGKEVSPHRDKVEEAIEYARKHDVLLIRSAGNKSFNTDIKPLYPFAKNLNEDYWDNLITVGASTKEGKLSTLSCYGKESVDILAPGEDITSSLPKGKWATRSEANLSAPIVSGIASVIRSYFPDLSAKEVKKILVASVTDVSHQQTLLPGKEKRTAKMKDVCRSGGVVNALNAFNSAKKKSKYGIKPEIQ